MVAEANRRVRSLPYRIDELAFRVYLRHATDFATMRAVLNAMLGAAAPFACIVGDICRSDLLVEIEATALHNLESK